jgi:hypothetical protein
MNKRTRQHHLVTHDLAKHVCLLSAALWYVAASASALPADELVSKDVSIAAAIDHYIDARLGKEGVTPAPPADDATLVRRLMLDLAGRIPTPDEARAYVESSDPQKLPKLIQQLISSPDYVRHSAAEFEFLLKGYSEKSPSIHGYLLTAFEENRRWDRMFQDLLGESPDRKTAGKFVLGRLNDQDALVRDVSSIFLGMNIECARCHDHPYVDSISQEYYYGTRSFFGRCFNFQGQLHERQHGVVRFRPLEGEEREARLIFLTGQVVAEDLPPADERKKKIDAENKRIGELNKTFKEKKQFPPRPAFSRKAKFVEAALGAEGRQRMAASIVNRLWYRFFGRGLVMPVDQIHAQNPASHPELLAWLGRDLIDHGFDLRRTTQGILSSRAYTRSSRWAGATPPQANLFAVSGVRPLSPLQYGRSLRLVDELSNWPAEQTPEQRAQRAEQLESGARVQYGKHLRPLKPGDQVGITEVLKFSNDPAILNSLGRNLVTALEQIPERREQIATASWAIYSRPPTEQELAAIVGWLNEQQWEDPDSVKLARQQRAEIQTAQSRVAAIERRIQQIELPARQQAKRKVLERTSDYLAAVAKMVNSKDNADPAVVAAAHDLEPQLLERWSKLTQKNVAAISKIQLLDDKMNSINGSKQLLGWGSDATPWLGVNSGETPADAGFVVPARSLAVHPSPDKQIAIGWQSPLAGRVQVSLRVSDGHPGSGNGVDWAIVHRQAAGDRRLGAGFMKRGGSFPVGGGSTVVSELDVRRGEFISLVISAHDRQHACDTTICELKIAEVKGKRRIWNAAEQLKARIHLSNPLADTLGNRSVWHFYTVSDKNEKSAVALVSPASLLGQWIDMLHGQNDPQALSVLAVTIQRQLLLESKSAADVDKKLRIALLSPSGPLFVGVKLEAPLDEKAKAEIASLTVERNAVRQVAAKPLPPLPVGGEKRRHASLRQMVWAMLMSSEFRFNH